MLVGYGIIAVPTGIVTSELSRAVKGADQKSRSMTNCPVCGRSGHDTDATYCKYCGEHL
jgi:voltage-gated potassium channel